MLEVVEVRLMKMSMKEDPLLPITRIGVKEEWGEWSLEQEKRFELALAKEEREEEEEEDDDDDEREGEGEEGKSRRKWKWYERVAAMVPGKDASQVEKHYRDLVADVKCIEEGRIRLPNYRDLPESGADSPPPVAARFLAKDGTPFRKPPPPGGGFHHDPERRKGIPWTEEEHRLFLEGLDKFGKGDWRSISRNFVVSRTPTQVASHAQKYFIRLNSMNKEKRRTSIHDITTSTATTTNGARELGQEGTPTSLMQLPNSPSHPLFTTPKPTQYALPPPPPPTPTIGHPINTNPNGHAHAPFVSYVPTMTMPMPMPHPATYY